MKSEREVTHLLVVAAKIRADFLARLLADVLKACPNLSEEQAAQQKALLIEQLPKLQWRMGALDPRTTEGYVQGLKRAATEIAVLNGDTVEDVKELAGRLRLTIADIP